MYGVYPNNNGTSKREARLYLKEPENNKTPHIRTINVVVKKLNQTDFPSQSIFLDKMLNDLRTLNLLNYLKKNLEVNIRKFDENKLTLDPPIQPGDLPFGQLFRAIAFYKDHDEYVEFLDIFYSKF